MHFGWPRHRRVTRAERDEVTRRIMGEIAVLLAGDCGVREIARQLGRAPSTISRELQRNAAVRTGRPQYRASTAQTHADRRARASREGDAEEGTCRFMFWSL
jgi:IS30 family transposase